MKKTKTYPIIEKKVLNNKSRKGEYYYVKLEKNTRGSYYKTKPNYTKEDYVNTKKYGIINKRRGAIKTSATSQYYIKLAKGRKIEEMLGTGYAEHIIPDITKLSVHKLRTEYKNLLLDKKNKGIYGLKINNAQAKELAEILTRPVNTQKWAKHIEFIGTIYNEKGESLATITSPHQNKSLYQIKGELQGILRKGEHIQEQYGRIKETLEKKGYKYSFTKEGTVSRISMKMVYRK